MRQKTLIIGLICFLLLGWIVFDRLVTAPKQALRANEAVLREDLYNMRMAIDQYTKDKNKAPQSLDDLVSAGYLKAIPIDPFTGSNLTWQTLPDDVLTPIGKNVPGITDVRSGASLAGSDGKGYSSW